MKKKNLLEERFGELFSKILSTRDITENNVDSFFDPKYEDLLDPFLIDDMEKVVLRIHKAVKENHKVLVYSDYDCDGIPAGVLMFDFFKKINFDNFENYIPDRHTEGYGLNDEVVGYIKDNKFDLVITIDLGIAEIERVGIIKSFGIDVIIIDHHEQHQVLPDAYAILNPKKKQDKYPFKGLCGCGLAYKLVQAFLSRYGKEFDVLPGFEKWWLDLVAISTVADQVPLLGENRTLATFGLKVLQKTKRPGLVALFTIAKLNQKNISEGDIAFMIAPRINVASRMASPMLAFSLLSEKDNILAKMIAQNIEDLNKRENIWWLKQ